MEHNNEGAVRHITVGLILSWIVGIVYLVVGLGLIFSSVVGGVLGVLGGLVMLPTMSAFIRNKFGVNLSGGVRYLLATLLIGIGISLSVSANSSIHQGASQNTTPTQAIAPAGTPATSNERLELLSYKCSIEYGFSKITGEVKNISDKPMENVMAVGSIYTKDGTFVKSSDAIIEYNPILVGQTSPFQTITTSNPEGVKCKVEFKELFGGTIATKRTAE